MKKATNSSCGDTCTDGLGSEDGIFIHIYVHIILMRRIKYFLPARYYLAQRQRRKSENAARGAAEQ